METQTVAVSVRTRLGPIASIRAGVLRRLYQLWGRTPGRWRRQVLAAALPRVTLGACAVIQNERGQVLVLHHTYRKKAWGLPGGFVRRGEDPAKGLAREIREELGVDVVLGPLLSAERHLPSDHLTLYYSATLLGTPQVDQVEADALRYIQPEELLKLYGPEARKWFPILAA